MSKSPIKNKHKQIKVNKLSNSLYKSASLKNLSPLQIQEEISKEEKILNNFLTHYKYKDAENCDKKIIVLKKVLKKKKTTELKRRHTVEKEHLKIDEFSDVNNLRFFWDKKLEELKVRSLAAFDELKKNQEMEYHQLMSQKNKINIVKPSSLFLKLQKEEEGLVKLRKYREADFVRKRKEEQRKKDMNRSGKNKEKSLKFLEKKLMQKHANEELYLQNKFQAEFEELLKGKQMQLDNLNKKYSAKNKDLLIQQIREDNINKNRNYRKRIENLQKYYFNNYISVRKEYDTQKQMESVNHIYAELREKNILDGTEQNRENHESNYENENGEMGEDNNDFNKQQEILQNELKKNE